MAAPFARSECNSEFQTRETSDNGLPNGFALDLLTEGRNGSTAGETQLAQARRSDSLVRPTELLPSDKIDLRKTDVAQEQIRRVLGSLSETERGGIDPAIVRPASITNQCARIHAMSDRLAPGQPPALLQMSINPIIAYVNRMEGADPTRAIREVGVHLALFRHSLNKEFERIKSPIRIGPLQTAIDSEGRTFYGLPILHNGRETNILRVPPILSPKALQERLDNWPRTV